jgi:hypothetical protein
LVCRRPRRGAATGAFAIMVAVMFVATAVSAAVYYYSLGHATSAVGITSPLDSGAGGASSGSPANFTALAGQVSVADAVLPAENFAVNGTTSTFTCAQSASGAYLVLTDKNAGSDSVASVSISSIGGTTVFTPSGTCDIGSETTYIVFPATSELNSTAVSGQSYEGFVSMADGVPVTFQGTWQ